MGRVLVSLPTYNERENIEKVIEGVLAQGEEFDVMVVDDNSPDGTGRIVEKIGQENPRVSLIKRAGKMGLGSAHLTVMKEAKRSGYECVITMDADFSHNPKYLQPLAEAMKEYDLMMGSRYVEGGGTVGWGVKRKVMSRAANFFSRFILGLPFRDISGGFKAYKVSALDKLDLDHIYAQGYAFQEEMVYRCWKAGFRIGELPIIFEDRRRGESKITFKEGFKLLWTLLKLRLRGG